MFHNLRKAIRILRSPTMANDETREPLVRDRHLEHPMLSKREAQAPHRSVSRLGAA